MYLRIVKYFWDFICLIHAFGDFFIFSFCNKNFKRIGCAKARLLLIDHVKIASDRSNHSQMFFKTGDLKNSAVFTRKHLCRSLC